MSSISTANFFQNGGTASASSKSKPSGLAGNSDDAIVKEFLDEAKKSPIDRLREAWLKAHNMSEEDLAKLPADQRKAIEDAIGKSIREAMTKKKPQQQEAQKSFAETLAEVS